MDQTTHQKLLTVAIPTYNRAAFLELCLEAVCPQAIALRHEVDIIVSDNASDDSTARIVKSWQRNNCPIRYVRNEQNIGSDRNIAQCFNLARTAYVLILGDDDIILPDALPIITAHLRTHTFGVLYLRAYGYDRAYMNERPWSSALQLRVIESTDAFLLETNVNTTFISSNIINKSLMSDLDAEQFCGTRLVQTYLVLEAVARSKINGIQDGFLVACKRHNSGGYNPFSVFSTDLTTAFERYVARALSPDTLRRIHKRILLEFFPYYIFVALVNRAPTTDAIWHALEPTFGDYIVFRRIIAPLLRLPRAAAIPASLFLVVYGRIRRGEFGRLFQFAYQSLRARFRHQD